MAVTKEEKNLHIWNQQEPQPIAVPLIGRSSPHGGNKERKRDYLFVGRELLISELLTVLRETRNRKGCYLISGFRGAGKTRLIDKVLANYKNNESGTSWLPQAHKLFKRNKFGILIYSRQFKRTINRARKKLWACIKPEKQNELLSIFSPKLTQYWSEFCRIPSKLEKYLFPNQVIIVRVNLGQDESLSPKDVLFNTASLFYQKFNDRRKYTELLPGAISIIVGTFIFVQFFGNTFNAWLNKLFHYEKLPNWLSWIRIPAPLGESSNAIIFFGTIVTIIVYYIWTRHLHTNAHIIFLLKKLNRRMAYAVELNKSINSNGISFGRKETLPQLDARQIENEILDILKKCRKVFRILRRPDVIFVFDELDKIAYRHDHDVSKSFEQPSVGRDHRGRKRKVDDLLGALKNFITHGDARFFFIAGREMLDSYQAERGSTSSLYESLFTRVFEVPSLLTDPSDHNQQRMHSLLEVYVCRQLLDPDVAMYLWLQYANHHRDNDPHLEEDLHRKLTYSPFCLRTYYHYLHCAKGLDGREARRIVLGLRNFIQYLTLHSWGNLKRTEYLFANFTKQIDSADWRTKEDVENICGGFKNVELVLQFGLIDQQRIVLASNLYTQIYHDLGRQLTSSGDKLAVSTMAAFQYILKFHRHPFSRYHLERMSETVSTYRSPELNTMIDTLISKVLHPHVRRIRNSHYRYRFSGAFEQELRYISRVSDIESAAYNFSLDAAAPIKAHYIDQLNNMFEKKNQSVESNIAIYDICIIVGDLYALEQSFNEALIYFHKAVDLLGKCQQERPSDYAHLLVEALLRLGEIYERRQRYDQAASVYLQARATVNNLMAGASLELMAALKSGDSKWDVFRQPFWAYWFLQLKRSPTSLINRSPSKNSSDKLPFPASFEFPFNNDEDAVNHYRAGQLAFFCGRHVTAIGEFISAIKKSLIETESTDRATYLGAYAYLHLGENLFVLIMDRLRLGGESKKSDMLTVNQDTEKYYFNLVGMLNGGRKGKSDEVKYFKGGLTKLTGYFESEKVDFLSALGKLQLVVENGRESCSEDDIDVYLILGMMAHAARRLADNGLHYHAALAYLKILAIWGMLSDVIFQLTMICGGDIEGGGRKSFQSGELESARRMLLHSELWIRDVRVQAEKSVNSITAGGFTRFRARLLSRDMVPWPTDKDKSKTQAQFSGHLEDNSLGSILNDDEVRELGVSSQTLGRESNGLFSKIGNVAFEFTSIDHQLRGIMGRLFGPDNAKGLARKNSADSPGHGDEDEAEAVLFQLSMMGQKLVYLSMWENMAKYKFRFMSSRKPFNIPFNFTTPHSTSSLMFSHWLMGRRCLHWDVADALEVLGICYAKKTAKLEILARMLLNFGDKRFIPEIGKKEQVTLEEKVIEMVAEFRSHSVGLSDAKPNILCILEKIEEFEQARCDYDAKRTTIYELCAAAVHNFHRTVYYIKQISGNDQDLMFPDPSMVLYDLWQLLYCLVKIEKRQHQKRGYSVWIKLVREELSTSNLRRDFTPANFYDFQNVTVRTRDALSEAEQLCDVSNRGRSDSIKTRHFLADDYEDTRFHLDWTLVQMYSPTAGVLRRFVEAAEKQLNS